MSSCAGLDVERILVTNMDADAQVPSLYVQEVDRAAAAAEDPHLLVRSCLLMRITLPGLPLGHAIINLCDLVPVARKLRDALLRHKC
jgi:hypothetical protein